MNQAASESMFRRLMRFWRGAPRLRRSAYLLAACELTAAFALPHVLSEQWYFEHYQSDLRARAAIDSFFSTAQAPMSPDASAGWINTPGFSRDQWIIDEHGSRSSQAFNTARSPGKTRVMFLGSSMINGGSYADRTQTISANVAAPSVEALNFGTMLYRIDQSYLAYKTKLSQFDPDTVVVGLDAYAAESMTNVWIPLATRSEVNLPLVKPRFRLVDGRLVEEPAPLELLRLSPNDARPLMAYLEKHDGLYFTYEDSKRFGFTPIAYAANTLYRTAQRLKRRWIDERPSEDEELALSVLSQFRTDLSAQNKKLVLLLLPRQGAITGKAWSSDYREHQRIRTLLTSRGLPFVDALEPLRRAPIDAVFGADGIHYSPLGNRLIGGYLSRTLSLTSPSH